MGKMGNYYRRALGEPPPDVPASEPVPIAPPEPAQVVMKDRPTPHLRWWREMEEAKNKKEA